MEHLPVAVFAVVMGLAATAVGWQRATASFGVPPEVGQVLAWLATGVLVLAAGGYALKAIQCPAAVRAEWSHPVKLAFLPTTGISLVILTVALNRPAARRTRRHWCCPSTAPASAQPSPLTPARPSPAASCAAAWTCSATASTCAGCGAGPR